MGGPACSPDQLPISPRPSPPARTPAASAQVLSRCVSMVDSSGGTVPMTPQLLSSLLDTVTQMASRGLRTLCLSYRGEHAWRA